jgi:hypothetical protein
MSGIWIFLANAFVIGTLAVVAFALYKMFGGGHRHVH